jgi:23S rRNA pseudouridine1911/1915/1917 synthase
VSARRIELMAREADGNSRLDKFLTQQIAGLGRHEAAQLCESGRVRVDGRRAKKSALVNTGATITVELDEPETLEPEPELPLELRLERAELVVVNKPPACRPHP